MTSDREARLREHRQEMRELKAAVVESQETVRTMRLALERLSESDREELTADHERRVTARLVELRLLEPVE